jgi:hypothetical protein
MVMVIATAIVMGNGYRIWIYDLLKCVCDYMRQRQSPCLLHESRVAEKSVKGAPNLQDLRSLTILIYIIYLYTILLRFRPPGLKSIYLL